jgi:hypothetical protein
MSFLSSMSMIFRADFVSPYLDSCSFCLFNQHQCTITSTSAQFSKHFATEWTTTIPEILQGQQLCYLLEQLLIEGGEHLEVLHQNFNCLGPIMPVEPTTKSAQIDRDSAQVPKAALT